MLYIDDVGQKCWSAEGSRGGSSLTLEGLESRVARPPLVLQRGRVGVRVGVAVALHYSRRFRE
jgi:hypothetical protein